MSLLDKYYEKHFPFDKMRAGQKKAINNILDRLGSHGTKYVIVQAPTGSGKSGLAMTVANVFEDWYGKMALQDNRLSTESTYRVPPASTTKVDEAIANLTQTVIITPKKALQDQYAREFSTYDQVAVLKGKANYTCRADPNLNGSWCPLKNKTEAKRYMDNHPEVREDMGDGHCLCSSRPMEKWCDYKLAKFNSYTKHVPVLNFANFSFWNRLGAENSARRYDRKRMGRTLIVDEAHEFPKFLSDYFSTKFDVDAIWEELGEEELETGELQMTAEERELYGVEEDYPFAYLRSFVALNRIKDSVNMFMDDVRGGRDPATFNSHVHLSALEFFRQFYMTKAGVAKENNNDKEMFHALKRTEMLYRFISACKSLMSQDIKHEDMPWFLALDGQGRLVIGSKSPAYGFHVFTGAYTHVILMSGTVIARDIMRELNISKDKAHVEIIPPATHVASRPLLYVGSYGTSLSYKNRDKGMVQCAKILSAILVHHRTWRGIIHTHSGALTRLLRQNLQGILDTGQLSRFIWHEGGDKRAEVEKFMRDTEDNSILVSPSLVEGFDGKGDIARWQVILKIPFPPRNDALIAAKLKEENGERWYNEQVANTLAQAYGRVNRGPGDLGVTYILDGMLPFFLKNIKKCRLDHDLPPAFLEALQNCQNFVFINRKDGDGWRQFPALVGSKREKDAEETIKPAALFI